VRDCYRIAEHDDDASKPGDVIITGTPGGVGVREIQNYFMQPGDVFEARDRANGTLSNPVADEAV